jgi:hypothetical protein
MTKESRFHSWQEKDIVFSSLYDVPYRLWDPPSLLANTGIPCKGIKRSNMNLTNEQ